ncbi:4Fe-4S binding protein [Desulfolucanica intricata]|uniref:4Fe-4S binding protein n=1 Tax=Desulfolucanica intricata TaxID=1285191 RepID=UPI0008311CF3|nr:4Fe-4S binding protein [Desulfolucanica intricata]
MTNKSKKLIEVKLKRTSLQALTWVGLPLVAIGGLFKPIIGFLLLGCMIGSVGIAAFRGRAWCDWMCPRGSFFDIIIAPISRRKSIPSFFRYTGVRIFMLMLILTVIGVQFYLGWGDLNAMAMAFVRVLITTTIIGIFLGIIIHPRVWCHICPMGTLGNWISKGKKPLYIDKGCAGCELCAAACPMQLNPSEYKFEKVMGDNDCIKCGSCVAACPKRVLTFEQKKDDHGGTPISDCKSA